MKKVKFHSKNNKPAILALGAEFDTRIALCCGGQIYFSKNTDEIAENYSELEKFILNFIDSCQIIPNIIITDLHPLYNSTQIGKKLAKKNKARYFQVQHHLSHIFASIGDYMLSNKIEIKNYKKIVGIACDGTGYGLDKKIWGGEIFYGNRRIGHLEKQLLIGGELAVKEPARMAISILAKSLSKKEIYEFVKKYYSQNEFEIIFSQMEQKFNCQETSSAGRVLDAASILLGFCENGREYKHYPSKMLEKNSQKTSARIKPIIKKNILQTSPLMKYIADAIYDKNKDKKQISFLAQTYIIEGLFKIAKKFQKDNNLPIFLSGGLANNAILKDFASKNNIYINKTISCGDEGIAFGQIIYFLANSRHNSSFRNIQLFFT